MKFVYEYRTSDNVRHAGVVVAFDRDAAFAALKSQGIRPSSLRDAPGLANKLFGKGKRWLAIVLLAVVCVSVGTLYLRTSTSLSILSNLSDLSNLDSSVRRQLIGDAAIIEKGIRTGWSDVFTLEGERFFASFAIPGVPAAVRSTTEEKVREALADDIESNASRRVANASNSLEHRQILAIVAGIKVELRQFLADGGTIAEYCRRLVQRQEQEIGYYNQAKTELEMAAKSGASDAAIEELWEKRNAALRAIGVKLVALPESER